MVKSGQHLHSTHNRLKNTTLLQGGRSRMEGEVKALSREALHAARGWAGAWGLGAGAGPIPVGAARVTKVNFPRGRQGDGRE